MSLERMLDAAADRYAWVTAAPCVRLPALREQLEGFGGRPSAEALALCQAPCRVRANCVRHAFELSCDYGWYGGIAPGKRKEFESADECLEWMLEQGLLPRRRS